MSDIREVRCDECNSLLFKMRNGLLIIKTKHHGKDHTTVITFETLREWMLNTDQEKREGGWAA